MAASDPTRCGARKRGHQALVIEARRSHLVSVETELECVVGNLQASRQDSKVRAKEWIVILYADFMIHMSAAELEV